MLGARLLQAYRATGADLPFGDPRRAHGVSFEGYYWRLTDAGAGRVVIALCGVCRAADGPWALVALAAEPEGLVRWEIVPAGVRADPERLAVRAGAAFEATEGRLRVELGPGARLDVALSEQRAWPRRSFGALGPAHALPGLGQYWHPHLLGARVEGSAELGGAPVGLAGATAYAEKNWGASFSKHWWWGQAQGFAGADACVAFAGGRIRHGGVSASPTAVVLRVEDELLALAPPLARMSAATGEEAWRIRARSARHEVELEGEGAGGDHALLPVPVPAQRRVELRSRQHLAGVLRVRVRRGRRTLFTGESRLAGLERGAP